MFCYEIIKGNVFRSPVFRRTCVSSHSFFFFLYRKFNFIALYRRLSEMFTVAKRMRDFNLGQADCLG